MDNKLQNGLIFTAGLVIGGLVTYFSVKDKFANQAQEEIDSVVESLSKREKEEPTENVSKEESVPNKEAKETKEKPDLLEYMKYTKNASAYSSKEPENVENLRFFSKVISPQEFGTMENYKMETYTYYHKDDVLVDEDGYVVPDDIVEAEIGLDFKDAFGEYEDDSVHLRNEALQKEYEILYDPGKFYD